MSGMVSSATPGELDRYCTSASAYATEFAAWARRVGVDHRFARQALGLQALSNLSSELGGRVARIAKSFRDADAVFIGDLLAVGQREVGYREGRNNDNVFGRWYGANHEAWCAMFVSWAFAKAGRPLPEIQAAKGFAKVGRAFVWARRNGRLAKSPEPGDIFLISHDGNNGHTGIVKTVNRDGTVTTLEGNTNTAGSRTGDGVYERTRLVASINAGFVRIGGELTVLDAWDGADMFADLDSRRSGKTRPRKNRKPRQRSRKGRR